MRCRLLRCGGLLSGVHPPPDVFLALVVTFGVDGPILCDEASETFAGRAVGVGALLSHTKTMPWYDHSCPANRRERVLSLSPAP